jgi:hypothetical protein
MLTGKSCRRFKRALCLHYKLECSTKCGILSLFGLLDAKDEGATLFLKAGTYQSTRRNIPKDFNVQQQRHFNCKGQ